MVGLPGAQALPQAGVVSCSIPALSPMPVMLGHCCPLAVIPHGDLLTAAGVCTSLYPRMDHLLLRNSAVVRAMGQRAGMVGAEGLKIQWVPVLGQAELCCRLLCCSSVCNLWCKATSTLYSEIVLSAHGTGPGKPMNPSTLPSQGHAPLHALPASSLSPTCPQRNLDGARTSCYSGFAAQEVDQDPAEPTASSASPRQPQDTARM